MTSLNISNLFSSINHTDTIDGKDATLQNLKLLLLSNKITLFGDPYFGTNLQKLLFNKNDVILKDIIIDEIYTAIIEFIPQISINRNDIDLIIDKERIDLIINSKNNINYVTNLYNINLTDDAKDFSK